MLGFNGGTLGPKNVVDGDGASGTYTLREQCLYQRELAWPESYVRNGLILRVDANNSSSYGGTGTTWFDISGNGRDLSLVNGVSFNAAGYFDFDGSDQYADTSDCGLSNGNPAHTLEMWVNADRWSRSGKRWWLAVVGKRGTGAHQWAGKSQTNTDFGVWSGTQTDPTLQGAGNWQQIVSTHDGTTLKYYVNASQSGSTLTVSFDFDNDNFHIGKGQTGTFDEYYDGKVSLVSLYDRALSAAEVTRNYDSVRGRYGI